MTDPKSSDSDIISSAGHSEAGIPTKEISEKDIALAGGNQQFRPKPALRRQVSEWEALQIVAAGDIETIEEEIDEAQGDHRWRTVFDSVQGHPQPRQAHCHDG